jgi:hypothetical protein
MFFRHSVPGTLAAWHSVLGIVCLAHKEGPTFGRDETKLYHAYVLVLVVTCQ